MSAAKFLGSFFSFAAVAAAASPLGGCIVPEAAPLLGHEVKKRLVYDVVRGVQCEIRHAVLEEIRADRDEHRWGKRKFAWLEDWAAKMDLNVRVEDMFGLNPGVALNTPNWIDAHVRRADGTLKTVGQSYNFGIGGGLSYDVSRYDKVEFAYDFGSFKDDKTENVNAPCYHFGGITLDTDLKLHDWLDDVLEPIKQCAFLGRPLDEGEQEPTPLPTRMLQPAAPPAEWCLNTDLSKDPKAKASPILNFSHDVMFTITFDINATPNWSLVRVSTANARLLDANRKDFSELLITLGPKEKPGPGTPQKARGLAAKGAGAPVVSSRLAPEAREAFQALQIGSAVRNN